MPTKRQLEREIEGIARAYNEDPSSPRVQEIRGFLSRTDAAVAAAQGRGGSYAGESGEFDPALYEAANRAAGLRANVRRATRELSARKRAYALRARRPTRGNLAARIADLETLRSATRGRERDRYERALADARSELGAGRLRKGPSGPRSPET